VPSDCFSPILVWSLFHFVNNSCSELQIHRERERERESGEVQASRKVTEEDIFCAQVFIRYDLSLSFSKSLLSVVPLMVNVGFRFAGTTFTVEM
jgi:ABC-type siderophore export system fused ATPase/permease subunit